MNITTHSQDQPACDLALRIGISRRMPRQDRSAGRPFCDLRLPMLAPSPALDRAFGKGELTFREFAARYRKEMERVRGILVLVSLFARIHPVSLGCPCRRGRHCHGRILKRLIEEMESPLAGDASEEPHKGASPVCYQEEEELLQNPQRSRSLVRSSSRTLNTPKQPTKKHAARRRP